LALQRETENVNSAIMHFYIWELHCSNLETLLRDKATECEADHTTLSIASLIMCETASTPTYVFKAWYLGSERIL